MTIRMTDVAHASGVCSCQNPERGGVSWVAESASFTSTPSDSPPLRIWDAMDASDWNVGRNRCRKPLCS
jgi:hypothetical protein